MTHRPAPVRVSTVAYLRSHVLDVLLASTRGLKFRDLAAETQRRANRQASFEFSEVEAAIWELTRSGELDVWEGRWRAARWRS